MSPAMARIMSTSRANLATTTSLFGDARCSVSLTITCSTLPIGECRACRMTAVRRRRPDDAARPDRAARAAGFSANHVELVVHQHRIDDRVRRQHRHARLHQFAKLLGARSRRSPRATITASTYVDVQQRLPTVERAGPAWSAERRVLRLPIAWRSRQTPTEYEPTARHDGSRTTPGVVGIGAEQGDAQDGRRSGSCQSSISPSQVSARGADNSGRAGRRSVVNTSSALRRRRNRPTSPIRRRPGSWRCDRRRASGCLPSRACRRPDTRARTSASSMASAVWR